MGICLLGFTHENYEVMVPYDTRLWPCNKHHITHGIQWIFSFSTVLAIKELTSDLLFTKYQADPHCLANQNRPDNRHWRDCAKANPSETLKIPFFNLTILSFDL